MQIRLINPIELPSDTTLINPTELLADTTMLSPEEQRRIEENKKLLGLFLAKEELIHKGTKSFWSPGINPLNDPTEFTELAKHIDINPLPQFISLTHRLLKSPAGNGPKEYVYRVYGEELGKGQFSKVYEIIGSISVSLTYLANYQGGKKQVAKDLQSKRKESPDNFKKRVIKEYEFLDRFIDTSVKEPVFYPHGNSDMAVIIMQHIPGLDLEKLIIRDKEYSWLFEDEYLSVGERLQASIEVALTMRRLHQHYLLHRDFKHANVMFDRKTRIAHFVDLGLSCDSRQENYDVVGTAAYGPPERLMIDQEKKKLKTPYTEKCDLFYLGWLEALIWRAADNPSENYEEAYNLATRCVFKGIFSDISKKELPRDQRSMLSKAIYKLVKCYPEERSSLHEHLTVLHQIWLMRKLAVTAKTKHNAIIYACAAAAKLIKTWDELQSSKPSTFYYLRELIKNFNDSLTNVENSQEALETFLYPFHSTIFSELTSKDAIQQRMDKLCDDYYSYINKLAELLSQVFNLIRRAPAESKIYNELNRMHIRLKRLEANGVNLTTLDEIALFNKKCEKITKKFENRIQTLNKESSLASIEQSGAMASSSRGSSYANNSFILHPSTSTTRPTSEVIKAPQASTFNK